MQINYNDKNYLLSEQVLITQKFKLKKRFLLVNYHVDAFREVYATITGPAQPLHVQNIEGVHLALWSELGTGLRGVFREGVHLTYRGCT